MADDEIQKILEVLPPNQKKRFRGFAKSLGVREGDIPFPLLVILENYIFLLKELVGQIALAVTQFINSASDAAAASAELEAAKAQTRIEEAERQAKERLREFIKEAVQNGVNEAVRETKTKVSQLTNQAAIAVAKADLAEAQAKTVEARERQFKVAAIVCGVLLCLGIAIGWGASSLWLNKFFEGNDLRYARNLVIWNVDRIMKCQADDNPKCTVWILPLEQRK